ncbi:MAG: dTMP kinase [Halioglobus sp.]
MTRSRGLFITVEGGEGVGKSTNIDFLEKHLQNQGVELVITREPGGTPLAENIRNLLLQVDTEPVDQITELLLIFASRAQHLKQLIEPALASGKWVLCDRFTDATYAYQSGGRQIEPRKVQMLEQLVQGEMRPDYTLLLDAPVELGMERARGRGELDRFEREELDFFHRVRHTYLQLAQESSGRYRIIDASLSLEAVQQQLLKVCSELLACWGVRNNPL